MKILKISLVLLLALIMYTVTDFNEVDASSATITWEMDTTAENHSLRGSIDFGSGIREIHLSFPYDEFITNDNGEDIHEIKFYALGVLVNTLDGENTFGDYLRGEHIYYLNLDVNNIDETATTLLWIIPTGYTTTVPAPAGYIDDLNDASVVSLSSGIIDVGFTRFYWEESVSPSNANYLFGTKTDLPLGTEFLGFRYNFSIWYNLWDENALIYFYDENDILLDTLQFRDYDISGWGDPDNPYGSVDIPIRDVINYENIDYFIIRMVISQFHVGTLESWSTGFIYILDGEVNTVNFYSEGVIVYSHKALLGSIARFPQTYPTKEGELFTHWITANGVEYNWTAIDEDMLIGDAVNFYAVFEDIPDIIPITVIDPTADETSLFTGALTTMGFNDPISRTIVFGFVAMITAGLMFWKGISVIAIVVVVGIELFFFMYLGLIPAFVSIIIILVLVFVGWSYRSGDAS